MTRTALIATVAFGLACAAAPTVAQTVYYTPAPNDGPAPAVSGIVVEGHTNRDGEEVVSQTVSYADLDVSTHDGARVLFRRIRNAAQDICGSGDSWSGEIHDDPLKMGCAERAVTLAMYRAQIPALTYIYESGRH